VLDPKLQRTLADMAAESVSARQRVTADPKSAQARAMAMGMAVEREHLAALDALAPAIARMVLLHCAVRRIEGKPFDLVGALRGVTGLDTFDSPECLTAAVDEVVGEIAASMGRPATP
jgi:hemoglobin-like flavoprotein